jgi:hypothetical protein
MAKRRTTQGPPPQKFSPRERVVRALGREGKGGRPAVSLEWLGIRTGLSSNAVKTAVFSLVGDDIVIPVGGEGQPQRYRLLSPKERAERIRGHSPPPSRPRGAVYGPTFRPPPRVESAETTARHEAHQLRRRRSAALREIAAMFAGVRLLAAVEHDELRVNGQLIGVPSRVIEDVAARGEWVTRLIDADFSDELVATVRTVLDQHGRMDLVVASGEDSILIRTGEIELARLTAALVTLADGRTITGAFHTPGAHWDECIRALRSAAARPVAASLPLRTFDRFPIETDPNLAREGLLASRMLRHERIFVFDRPVRLEHAVVTVRFAPLMGPVDALTVPFDVSLPTGDLAGQLHLVGELDPLQLTCAAPDVALIAIAWPLALIGYAELTCGEPVTRGLPSRTRALDGGARGAESVRRLKRGGSDRDATAMSNSLTPRGLSIAYVVGHPVHIGPMRNRSAEAERHARDAGIVLKPDYTWRRPYVRGQRSLPPDQELRFGWHASETATTAIGTRAPDPRPQASPRGPPAG